MKWFDRLSLNKTSALTSTTASNPPASGPITGERVPPESPTDAASPQNDATPLSRRSRRLIFTVGVAALIMSSLDATIVVTALPAIHHELHATINWAAWTITIYQLGQLITMPLAGRISDLFGRRRLFIAALFIFTASSLACGFANSIYLLVILRVIQAIGGGTFMPVVTGIVSDRFGKDRDRAIGMFTSIFPIGGVVGPLVGGIIVSYWSWRGIFLVNVPIGIVLLIAAWRVIPESRTTSKSKVDTRGIFLLTAAILLVMCGISVHGDSGSSFTDPLFLAPEIAGIAMGVLFVRHIFHFDDPIIPKQLLFGRGFASTNFVSIIIGAMAFGTSALVPLYAENRYHIDVLRASTLLTARSIGVISIASATALLMRRIGTRWPMLIGFSMLSASLLIMSKGAFGMSPYVWLTIGMGINGIALGLVIPPANNASMHLAPQYVSSIVGVRGMFRQSGGIINISVMTALIARSADPGLLQAHSFIIFAAICALTILPIRFVIPDQRGRW